MPKEPRKDKVYGAGAVLGCAQCAAGMIRLPKMPFTPVESPDRPISAGTTHWERHCPNLCGYKLIFVPVATPTLAAGRGWLIIEEVFRASAHPTVDQWTIPPLPDA